MKIGIFDSGFGGLTTLKELLSIGSEYDYLYLGDNARTPYGNRDEQIVLEYTREGIEFLFSRGAKIILIACNTASNHALRTLQEEYKNTDKKILGVLIPAVEKALECSRFGRIGIVGTKSTIEAGNYTKEIEKRIPAHYKPLHKKSQEIPSIYTKACPLLVPLIEEGWSKKPETVMITKKYLLSLKSCNIDTLILGCTHYPLIQKIFERKMGKNCIIINSGKAQAQKFIEYLENHPEIKSELSTQNNVEYFTTGEPSNFKTMGKKFVGRGIGKVERVHF